VTWIKLVILPKQIDGFVGKLIHEHDFQWLLLRRGECSEGEQDKSYTFDNANHIIISRRGGDEISGLIFV
jgi:hypothetical protein